MSTAQASVDDKVREIISQQLEVPLDKVVPAASFIDDLKADSLAIVELVLAIEEHFSIEIPDEDTENLKTVKDAIDYVRAHSRG
jgi:acyl carrier protein